MQGEVGEWVQEEYLEGRGNRGRFLKECVYLIFGVVKISKKLKILGD